MKEPIKPTDEIVNPFVDTSKDAVDKVIDFSIEYINNYISKHFTNYPSDKDCTAEIYCTDVHHITKDHNTILYAMRQVQKIYDNAGWRVWSSYGSCFYFTLNKIKDKPSKFMI